MEDVARRRPTIAVDPAELPEWMHSLAGYDRLDTERDGDSISVTYEGVPAPIPPPPEGMWQVHLVGPNDLEGMEEHFDPLLLVALLAGGVAKLDEQIEGLVGYARSRGRTWTQIGSALGVSKQSAWERFSGED